MRDKMISKEQLEDRVEKIPESGCWIWMRAVDRDGYGMSWKNGKSIRAHRAVWEAFNGLIPKGQNLLHRCDTPSCCNPNHLFLGTCGDNSKDMVCKNRQAIGEHNGQAKITSKDVIAIRSDDRLHREIAEDYGISRSAVTLIKANKKWRHL